MSDVPYKYLKENDEVFYPIIGPSSFNGALPVSKGGTGAPTPAAARANLGINGSPTLLWTNDSPLSSFAAQTVQLDLSAYSFVIIEFAEGPYTAGVLAQMAPVPTVTPPTGYAAYNKLFGITQSGAECRFCCRTFTVSASGIEFSSGQYVDTYGGTNTTNNNMCKPWRIWGVV